MTKSDEFAAPRKQTASTLGLTSCHARQVYTCCPRSSPVKIARSGMSLPSTGIQVTGPQGPWAQ